MFSVALVGLLGDAPERQALLRMGSRRRLVTRLPGRLRSSAHGSLCWHLSLLALWCHDRHSGRAGLIHVSENSAHWGSMRPEMRDSGTVEASASSTSGEDAGQGGFR
jgi:hypothetical protein